jgi:hypothetical protein
MKYLILSLTLMVSMTAMAEDEMNYQCTGVGKSVGKKLIVRSNQPGRKMKDGDSGTFTLIVMKKGKEVWKNESVVGQLEDVQFSLKSKRGTPYFSGTIFLDELDQTSTTSKGRTGRRYNDDFDCES